MLDVSAHVDALGQEGELLAAAAASAGLDAPVPTCPEWRVRDLPRHVGNVHRWAAAVVRERRTLPIDAEEQRALFGAPPPDEELLGWFRAGHRALVEALAGAAPDLECWAFLPAPSPLAFWARRQAHETAIHRFDAESAAGRSSPLGAVFAADGVDEVLGGFAARPQSRLRSPLLRILGICATDTGDAWMVRVGPESVEVDRGGLEHAAGAGCLVAGNASALYLLLWNRRGPEGLDIAGERDVLDLWRQLMAVRWSGPS